MAIDLNFHPKGYLTVEARTFDSPARPFVTLEIATSGGTVCFFASDLEQARKIAEGALEMLNQAQALFAVEPSKDVEVVF